MDQDRDSFHEESHINLLTLPTELLVYIISFLSTLRDRVKLRYVSRWLRCVIERTPSLWKEFVWPYYDSREECSVKEVLKVCGQHIKILSFPICRTPLTLLGMLQYCSSNVQHLSLLSAELDPDEQLFRNTVLGCLQTLELKVDYLYYNFKQLLLNTGQLRELKIHFYGLGQSPITELLKHWKELEFMPTSIAKYGTEYSIETLAGIAVRLMTIPTGTTAKFRAFKKSRKVPFNFSPILPYFQLHFEGSDQVTIPCVKLSDCGILGLEHDLGIITDCQYGGKTMCMVQYYYIAYTIKCSKSRLIARYGSLSCATHFDLSECSSLQSGHLKQITIACPNLQRLDLQGCRHCLASLHGLRAIASHCYYLQGLNLLNIPVLKDHILLWEILSDMKLTHLGINFSTFGSEAANKEQFVSKVLDCKRNPELF